MEAIIGNKDLEVNDLPSHIDHALPLEPQIEAVLDPTGFTPLQWQTEGFIVNLPALSCSAAVTLAQIHGKAGYFPPVLRLRSEPGHISPCYEVAEILSLQEIRDRALAKRYWFIS